MVDQEVIGSQLKRDRFPFRSEGDITLAVRNANYTPETADVAHRHEAWRVFWHISTEARPRHCMLWRARLYQRGQYQAGTSLHFKAGGVHVPARH
jgi:hypothetical protein